MAAFWTFCDFVDERGRNVMQMWLSSLPVSVRDDVKATLNIKLRYLEHFEQLPPSKFEALRGYDGIYELRFKERSVQYRPICCYGPIDGMVTMLAGAIEKDWQLLPRSVCAEAEKRRHLVLGDRRYVCAHDYS